MLFSGTIKENIRYGRLDATDEEIEKTRTLLEECLKSYHYLEKTQVECDEVKINIEEKEIALFLT